MLPAHYRGTFTMPPEDRKLAAAATAPAKPAADESVARSLARLHGAAEAIVSATGQAIYVWDIASDAIEWSGNFARLIGLDAGEARHLKGRSFEAMLSSRSQETRFGVVVSAAEAATARAPVPYQCVYLLHPDAAVEKPPLWIEDTGCWYPGENGKPVRAQGSVRIINERRSREEDLRRQSDFDDLTGLPNRRSLERQLDAAIRDAEHRGTVSTFLILSIDRLDTINDVFGFGHGDRVLREAGRRIQAKLRADDVVCRRRAPSSA